MREKIPLERHHRVLQCIRQVETGLNVVAQLQMDPQARPLQPVMIDLARWGPVDPQIGRVIKGAESKAFLEGDRNGGRKRGTKGWGRQLDRAVKRIVP